MVMYQLQIGGHIIMEEGENGYRGTTSSQLLYFPYGDPSWRIE